MKEIVKEYAQSVNPLQEYSSDEENNYRYKPHPYCFDFLNRFDAFG